MNEQAARLSGICEGCDNLCTGWAVQLVKGGRLRWEVEWACDQCGISHDGDWGSAPADVRNMILAQHGPHCLMLTNMEYRGGGIMKAFRDAFNASIRQSKEFATELKQCGYEATYVEAHLLSDLLRGEGVPSIVHPGRCKRREVS